MPIKTARFWVPVGAAIMSVMGLGYLGTAAPQEQRPGVASYSVIGGRGAMMCRMDEHIDGQLAYLKTELKITEIQSPQWNIFAQAFRAETEKKAQLCREAMEQARASASASLLDSLKTMEDQMARRLDSLRAMRAAVQPLYSILSREQKKTADEIMKRAPNS
jgi:LTXXQ motif family protein